MREARVQASSNKKKDVIAGHWKKSKLVRSFDAVHQSTPEILRTKNHASIYIYVSLSLSIFLSPSF